MQTLNPKYDGAGFTYTIQNGGVEGLVLNSAQLTNITPIHIFKDLRELTVVAPYGQSGQPRGGVSDLGPLRGMTKLDRLYMDNISVTDLAPMAKLPITSLTIWGFAGRDLAPLQGMKLKYLNCGLSKVEDLTPLRGMPLEYLCLNISDVSDLTPLKGMKLKALLVEHTKVRDLGPAWDMPLESLAVAVAPITDLHRIRQLSLKHIWLDYNPAKHLELLRSIKTLEYINYRSAAEVLTTRTSKNPFQKPFPPGPNADRQRPLFLNLRRRKRDALVTNAALGITLYLSAPASPISAIFPSV